MAILKEFQEFAVKGNAIDMAVGLVIGAAFGKVVTSLVNDIIMQPLSFLLGKLDFSNVVLNINGQPFLKYGAFLTAILDFLIVAFALFLVIKQINRLKRTAPAAAPTTKDCPKCCSAIPIGAVRCPFCTSELSK